jgi:hypothetical protein
MVLVCGLKDADPVPIRLVCDFVAFITLGGIAIATFGV